MNKNLLFIIVLVFAIRVIPEVQASIKPRVVIMSDAEIDDRCSFVRFLLYGNDFDIEGIITTSSQYHAHDHNWAGDDWSDPYLSAYESVYPNLVQHDSSYPTPDYLRAHSFLGNVDSEGEMEKITPGSQHIVNLLLDQSDDRPIWFQAWGGMNTLARALKTIEETHPEKMEYVAGKMRFYFIWEQDNTFQSYIRPHWATPYNILTIISDQFITFGYWWQRWNMPEEPDSYFRSLWMKENIFKDMNINPLIALYNENTKEKLGGKEDFIGEGDSPSFIHEIPTGLRSTESPDWGGWGGRYVLIRENTWLDKVPIDGYSYPSDRWYTSTGWGRQHYTSASQALLEEYFKPITRWIDVIQNDFAARVDWCVKPYTECNHQPVVKLKNDLDITAKPGSQIQLSAEGTYDPDGDLLVYKWWQYHEAESYKGNIEIEDSLNQDASFVVPVNADIGETIHLICEVKDNGSPELTRYGRVIVTVNSDNTTGIEESKGQDNFPRNFVLAQNYPNPFNPSTIIKYEVPEPCFVTIRVFNIIGKEISTLVNAYKKVGIYKVKFDGSDLESGIYLVQMNAESLYQSIKIVLIK